MIIAQAKKSVLGRNVLSLGVVQVANYAMPLITVPIVSRIIGPEKFGVINFAIAFMAYFTLMISYGFNLTATRRLAANPHDKINRNLVFSEVFNAQAILLVLSSCLFIVCLILVPQLREEWVVSTFAFLTCLATLLTQDWLFQAMQDLPKVAVLNFVSKFVFMVAILLVINERSDYIWYMLALSGSQVLVAAFSFLWSYKKYELTLYKVKLMRSFKLLWHEKTYFFSLVVINLYTSTTIVMLGVLTDAEDVGYYTAGLKLTFIIQTIFIIPFKQTFFPYMSKAINRNLDKGLHIAQKLLPIVVWPIFLLCLGTFFLSKYMIIILYGEAFAPSATVLQILAFVPLMIALSNVWGIIVMMNLKLDKIYFRITLICAVLSIILNLIVIPVWSYIGAAAVLLFTQSLGMLLIFLYLQRLKLKLINLSYFNPFTMRKILSDHLSR